MDSQQQKRPAETSEVVKRAKTDDYTCRVCFKSAARYVCPRCLLKLCSVKCTQAHKAADACSGKKDRTEFKTRGALGETELKSDLAFLSDVSEVVEATARFDGQIALNSALLASTSQHSISPSVSRAVRTVIAKSLVIFRQSPACADRRRRNTTCIRRKKFRWRVEWIVGEKLVVWKAQAPEVSLRKLKAMVVDDANDYVVLMMDESVPANQRGYIILDDCYSLAACLAGLLVVDFPTLYVVRKEEIGAPVAGYEFDINQLPSWAASVANSRIGVVGSYKGKPVYDKQYPEQEMLAEPLDIAGEALEPLGEPVEIQDQYTAVAEPSTPLVTVLPSEGEEDVDLDPPF